MSHSINLGLIPGTQGGLASGGSAATGSNSAGALQAQITSDQAQLNDWVTCVSASTPKGKAEIARLSGRISAAKEHIARIRAASAASQTSQSSPAKRASSASAPSTRVDLWA